MLNPIISGIVFLTEMLIAYIFFSNVFEKRLPTAHCLALGCLFYGLCSAINILAGNNGVINWMFSVAINIVFSCFCFHGKPYLSVFYSFILSAVNGSMEVVVITIVGALTGSDFLEYNSNFPLLVLECSTSKILYFFLILVFSKLVKSQTNKNKLPFNLFLYPVCTAVCQVIFWYINMLPETPYATQNLLAIASLFLLVATILLFVTYQHQLEKDNETMQMKSEYEKLQTEKTYFQILEQQNQQLMIYAHDAKKHLEAIRDLNPDPQISGYISKLSEQLVDYTRNCHSGNKLLDVMIHKFCVDCGLRGIQFEYDVKSCNLSSVVDLDLVAILGNLIDNAMTAAEQSEGKIVLLATSWRNDYSIIIVSNSCDTPPKMVGNALVTSKPDQALHGFGLKSVKQTLKKYEGDYEWLYDDHEHMFTVTAMIGQPPEVK